MDLFSYPQAAGYKERGGTSQQAAEAIQPRASILHTKVLRLLQSGIALTADEIAARLKESPLSIRPRVTELSKQGLIVDTGKVRPNQSGRNAHVWRAA